MAGKGENFSFEWLLAKYERPVFGYLSRVLRLREDAEDAVQETFIKVWKNIAKIDPSKNVKSWIFTIATNTAYDALRKKMKKPEILLGEISESALDNFFETNPENSAYNLVGSGYDLEKSLAGLKPAYRAALLLFYKEDLTYREMAKALKIPESTVKTHLRRAKMELMAKLKSDYGQTGNGN